MKTLLLITSLVFLCSCASGNKTYQFTPEEKKQLLSECSNKAPKNASKEFVDAYCNCAFPRLVNELTVNEMKLIDKYGESSIEANPILKNKIETITKDCALNNLDKMKW